MKMNKEKISLATAIISLAAAIINMVTSLFKGDRSPRGRKAPQAEGQPSFFIHYIMKAKDKTKLAFVISIIAFILSLINLALALSK